MCMPRPLMDQLDRAYRCKPPHMLSKSPDVKCPMIGYDRGYRTQPVFECLSIVHIRQFPGFASVYKPCWVHKHPRDSTRGRLNFHTGSSTKKYKIKQNEEAVEAFRDIHVIVNDVPMENVQFVKCHSIKNLF